MFFADKYEQIVDEHGEENDSTKNPLINLVGHYDSDSETDDKKMSSNKLNDKVDDFLKVNFSFLHTFFYFCSSNKI